MTVCRRVGVCAAAGELYAIGGCPTGSTYERSVEKFNPLTAEWTEVRSNSSAQYSAAMDSETSVHFIITAIASSRCCPSSNTFASSRCILIICTTARHSSLRLSSCVPSCHALHPYQSTPRRNIESSNHQNNESGPVVGAEHEACACVPGMFIDWRCYYSSRWGRRVAYLSRAGGPQWTLLPLTKLVSEIVSNGVELCGNVW